MKRDRLITIACFALAGTCAGLCAGFIVAARVIPVPHMPQSVKEAVSNEIEQINDELDGMPENQTGSENKWLSSAYRHWFYSLSKVEQHVIKFHDDSMNWAMWITGIGFAMVITGVLLRNKAKEL